MYRNMANVLIIYYVHKIYLGKKKIKKTYSIVYRLVVYTKPYFRLGANKV